MRIFHGIFVAFFLVSFTNILIAATVEKEFTFTLTPGEITKDWEVNASLPANESGKFIGRDFKPVVSDKNTELQIEKETLTDQKYYAKGKLIFIAPSQSSTATSAKLYVTLYTGNRVLNDIPAPPAMVEWAIGKKTILSWKGFGDAGRSQPLSAKYLKYEIREVSTNETVAQQIVPVYLAGFKIPCSWQLPQDSEYIAEVRLANTSAVFSKPTITNLPIMPVGKK